MLVQKWTGITDALLYLALGAERERLDGVSLWLTPLPLFNEPTLVPQTHRLTLETTGIPGALRLRPFERTVLAIRPVNFHSVSYDTRPNESLGDCQQGDLTLS